MMKRENIIKTTALTQSAVHLSRLQLQNVKHVLRVFNEKVSRKGLDQRFNDPHQAVQVKGSCYLDTFLYAFQQAGSGQGPTRKHCLTNDTKKVLTLSPEQNQTHKQEIFMS